MINILYICTPNSIHDIKWMSFFAEQKDKYKVYAIYESNEMFNNDFRENLSKHNINLLSKISPFSINNPYKTIKSVFAIRRFIKKYEIEIFHALFITPHAIWTNFINCPYVLTSRGTDILKTLPSLKEHKGVHGFYFKQLFNLFKRAINKANYITSTSGMQIESFKSMFKIQNIELIRTGVDVSLISKTTFYDEVPIELKDKSLIFSPRFIAPQYNVDYQIDAISFMDESILEKYYFVFIEGKNVDVEYLQKIKSRLSILKQSIGLKYLIYNYLEQKTMWGIYHLSDLCIMTPISDGTPNSALEAMAARCPVIVSDLKYDDALFDNTCIKTNLNNPQDLSDKINEILTHKPIIMIDNAFNAVEKYGNRQIEMSKLAEVYNKLLN